MNFCKSYARWSTPSSLGKILLAEANQWPEDVVEYFGSAEEPEFQMGFHFPVMPRLYMAMSREDRAPIIDILRRTPDIRPDCQWGTFLRNHDELTLEMVTLDEREYMWNVFAPEPSHEEQSRDSAAVGSSHEQQPRCHRAHQRA